MAPWRCSRRRATLTPNPSAQGRGGRVGPAAPSRFDFGRWALWRRKDAERLAVFAAILCAAALPVRAECHGGLFGTTGLDYRRSLQAELRGIGITGFGRTQPYRDSTISLFLDSDVTLILREQDDLVTEIGVDLPLPAEPLEIARFNALVAHAASRFSGEDETQLRARLLQSIGLHQAAGAWSETTDKVRLAYSRTPPALIAKLTMQTCR